MMEIFMEWNDLSLDAKSIIEWVECPREGDYNSVAIKVGEIFEKPTDRRIMVTQKLFDEVLNFVKEDANMQGMVSLDDELIFGFTKEYKDKQSDCDCCQGDEALYWVNDSNNAFVDSKGNILVTVKGMTMQFKVKYCPNCGRKF